jgi:hypothetical protein
MGDDVSEQLFPPFYGQMIRHDKFIHILRFLHFSNSDNALDNNDLNYDRLWKLRHVFDFMNNECTEYYTLFKGRITLTNRIPKGHVSEENFAIYVTRLCTHMRGYLLREV